MNDSNFRRARLGIRDIMRIESVRFIDWIPMQSFEFLTYLTVFVFQADGKAFATGVDVESQIAGNQSIVSGVRTQLRRGNGFSAPGDWRSWIHMRRGLTRLKIKMAGLRWHRNREHY